MASGDVTDALVDELQIRMENPEGDKFTDSICLLALNRAQVKTALLLHPSYLTELETKSTEQTAEANIEPYTALTPLCGAHGVIAVGVSDYEFVKEIDITEIPRTANTYLDGSTTNKLFYKWDDNIVFDTGLATQKCYIYYHETPATMSTTVDPTLDEHYHDIMLRFSEAILWSAEDKLERRKTAYQDAMEQIKRLNNKAFKNEPLPVGTGVERRLREGQE